MTTTTSSITNQNEPWMLPDFDYGSGVVALHREIEHFYDDIVCTPTEYMMRLEAIYRIENVVLSIWPKACVEVFGSFRTGLNLPTSDIDIAVNNFYRPNAPFQELKNALIDQGVAENVCVIGRASVPVIKFTDQISQVNFDICFNTSTGVKAAELVRRFINQFPELPKLVMVLKHFLMLQGLNKVYGAGGISSYALTIMCISFLQLQTREAKSFKKDNKLGKLLLKFLDYYGRKFDYFKYGISVWGNGAVLEKSRLQESFGDGCRWLSALTIEDPITPTNDVGRSSFGALDVKHCFEMAFLKLSKLVDRDSSDTSGSILASIVHVPQSVIDYRNWVNITFQHLTSIGQQPIDGLVRNWDFSIKSHMNLAEDDQQEQNGREKEVTCH